MLLHHLDKCWCRTLEQLVFAWLSLKWFEVDVVFANRSRLTGGVLAVTGRVCWTFVWTNDAFNSAWGRTSAFDDSKSFSVAWLGLLWYGRPVVSLFHDLRQLVLHIKFEAWYLQCIDRYLDLKWDDLPWNLSLEVQEFLFSGATPLGPTPRNPRVPVLVV